MSLDLIAGTVLLTAVFLVVAGWWGFASGRWTNSESSQPDRDRRGRMVFAVLLIVYFVGVTNVFVITQQYNLAFTNLIIGLILAGLQYFVGAPATSTQVESTDRETREP